MNNKTIKKEIRLLINEIGECCRFATGHAKRGETDQAQARMDQALRLRSRLKKLQASQEIIV
jgi:hypothetical protein